MKKNLLLMLCVGFLVVGMSMKIPTLSEKLSKPAVELNELLLPRDGGVLRGIHFNMSKEEVATIEAMAQSYINNKKYLAYHVPLSSDPYNRAKLYYDFDRAGLFRITIETFQDSEIAAAKLYSTAKKFFEKRIGDGYMSDDGYMVWLTKDENTGVEYEVAMIDVTSEGDSGIMIDFYIVAE